MKEVTAIRIYHAFRSLANAIKVLTIEHPDHALRDGEIKNVEVNLDALQHALLEDLEK